MPFLRPHDYTKLIQPKEWEGLKPHQAAVDAAYQAALEDAKSYIRYRFDVDKVFVDVTAWDPSKTYNEDDVVSVEAEEWDSSKEYQSGDLASFKDTVYKANATTSAEEPEGSSDWDAVGKKDTLYVAKTDGVTSFPNNASDWDQKDPRVPNIRMYLTDMVLYHLYSHTQPRAIPQFRMERYDKAMKFFEKLYAGEVSIPLPEAYPDSNKDSTIRTGGKLKNSY